MRGALFFSLKDNVSYEETGTKYKRGRNAKYLFFRNTTLVLGAFVVLAVLWQRIRGERTTKRTWKKTDVFMLLYLVSAIFS